MSVKSIKILQICLNLSNARKYERCYHISQASRSWKNPIERERRKNEKNVNGSLLLCADAVNRRHTRFGSE
jgi:hypothetical protein